MKRFVRFMFATVLLLALATTVWAATVSVDTFNDGNGAAIIITNSVNWPEIFTTGSSMIGGERDIRVELIGSGNTIAQVGNGQLSISTASNTGSALIQWDGIDNSMNLNATGLGGVDLTSSGTNDSLRLRVFTNDYPADVTFKAYTDSSNWSSFTFNTPGNILQGQSVDFVLPLSNFNVGGGSGVTWASVGAVEMLVDITIQQTDLVIDFFEVVPKMYDFGDLPDTYATTLSSNGARHTPDGLRLGGNIDTESDGPASGNSTNDDTTDVSDEDGIIRTPGVNWTQGQNGGSIDVTVNGCGSGNTCYLSGWIDWNDSNAFDQSGEKVLDDRAVSDGTQTITFNIPVDPSSGTFKARFRLCRSTNQCNTFNGEAPNGEVEDYQWSFGPTAITLETFGGTATGTDGRLLLAGALAGLFTLAGGWLVWRRR